MLHSHRHVAAIVTACVAIVLGGMTSARAFVISSTPTLPVLGVPYTSSSGVGCFLTAGVCVLPGTFTLTSVVSSTFNVRGQDIIANASSESTLTTLEHIPIGRVSLSGTIEQEVLGRTSATELGTWTTELIAMSLSGPVLGHTLTLTLDGAMLSTGATSIAPVGGSGLQQPLDLQQTFRIDSFFDVFVALSLDTVPPLSATRGPLHLSAGPLAAVPEPSTWLLFLTGFVGLLGYGWRQRQQTAELPGKRL